ncbi:MAG: holo-ACP synthase [Chloroflexota bacterium]|nr:holo-ACP synthase [Chloroflexota bacterium]
MSRLVTGIDIIEIERIVGAVSRHGDHFLERIFTARELAEVGNRPVSLAARFAAKEAVAKALGCGIGPVTWHEIEILRDDQKAPVLYLNGAAKMLADEQGLEIWSLSLSHTHVQAIAIAVAMGGG